MAYGRLGQAEAVACRGEAAEVPDREEDTQQIEIEVIISSIHSENYNHEFDLVQECQHVMHMSTAAINRRPGEAE